MPHGIEWLIDASGCPPDALREQVRIDRLFRRIVADLGLHPVGEPVWHRFPGGGGLTGLWLLQESHLACHTFPEHGTLCLNLFCCRPRPAWNWAGLLPELIGCAAVDVRCCERRFAGASAEAIRHGA